MNTVHQANTFSTSLIKTVDSVLDIVLNVFKLNNKDTNGVSRHSMTLLKRFKLKSKFSESF